MTCDRTFEDAFSILCGEKLGSGVYREVYECRIDPSLVVKVEIEQDWRSFANVKEHAVWWDWKDSGAIARWLAPCEQLSPDGRVLLQRRAQPLPGDYQLPSKLPAFLTDIKAANFGLIQGKLVCVDYAFVDITPSTRLRTAHWA